MPEPVCNSDLMGGSMADVWINGKITTNHRLFGAGGVVRGSHKDAVMTAMPVR
jgi:hypothetical protein